MRVLGGAVLAMSLASCGSRSVEDLDLPREGAQPGGEAVARAAPPHGKPARTPSFAPAMTLSFRGAAAAAAPLPGGGLVVVGTFEQAVDYGAGPRSSNGRGDAFVVAFDAGGSVAWHVTFGTAMEDSISRVAVDRDGSILVSGRSDGLDLFGGALDGEGPVFVARFSRAGQFVRGWRFSQPPYGSVPVGSIRGRAVVGVPSSAASAGQGAVILGEGTGTPSQTGLTMDRGAIAAIATSDSSFAMAGTFGGLLRVDGRPYGIASGSAALVSRHSWDGAPLWVRTFAGVSISGVSSGDAPIFGGSCTSTEWCRGSPSPTPAVLALDEGGNTKWYRTFTDAGFAGHGTVVAAHADGTGQVIAAGTFKGALDFGDRLQVSKDAEATFVARLDTVAGHTLWSGSLERLQLTSLVVDARNDVYLVGLGGSYDQRDPGRDIRIGWLLARVP